jgi:hypothetical protein
MASRHALTAQVSLHAAAAVLCKQGAGSHDAELLSVELAAQSQLFEAYGQRKLLQAAESDSESSTLEQLIAEAAAARFDSGNDSGNGMLMQQSRRKLWGLRGGDKRTQDVSIAPAYSYSANGCKYLFLMRSTSIAVLSYCDIKIGD